MLVCLHSRHSRLIQVYRNDIIDTFSAWIRRPRIGLEIVLFSKLCCYELCLKEISLYTYAQVNPSVGWHMAKNFYGIAVMVDNTICCLLHYMGHNMSECALDMFEQQRLINKVEIICRLL